MKSGHLEYETYARNFTPPRVVIISSKNAQERWASIRPILLAFKKAEWYVQRLKALEPIPDNCYLPYSLNDCCTRSHSQAIEDFAKTALKMTRWLLVLEDDVRIHPSVSHDNLTTRIQAIVEVAELSSAKFVYLGVCTHFDQIEACVENAIAVYSPEITLSRCENMHTRRCTHAYLVRESLARFLPDLIRNSTAQTIDEAFEILHAQGRINTLVANFHLKSPQIAGHIGLLYQDQGAFSKHSLTAVSQEKVVVLQPVFQGRLGNLMFQWAHVVSLQWSLSLEVSEEVLIHLPSVENTDGCPAKIFFEYFGLQRFARLSNAPLTHYQRAHTECTVELKERGANMFDEYIKDSILEEIKSRPNCTALTFTLTGYFQSFKYFMNATETTLVNESFQFSIREYAAVQRYYGRSKGDETIRIGIQVRLGDKERNAHFKGVYVPHSSAYYDEAIEYLQNIASARWPSKKLELVVSVGGSIDELGSVEDREIVQALFQDKYAADVHFIADNQFADMLVLSTCDAIVTGASSYGWWAAFLSNLPADLIVVPKHVIRPEHALAQEYKIEDYYPFGWKIIDNTKPPEM